MEGPSGRSAAATTAGAAPPSAGRRPLPRCPAGSRPCTQMGWNPLSWFSKPEPPKKKKICCACPETKVRGGGERRERPPRLVRLGLAHTIAHLTPPQPTALVCLP